MELAAKPVILPQRVITTLLAISIEIYSKHINIFIETPIGTILYYFTK